MNRRKVPAASALTALCAASLLASCAYTQPTATVTSGGGPSVAQAQSVPYDGPQARIAVTSFTDKTAKGYYQIGDGLADMLTTALFHTNRFIVLERQQLGEVLQEQDLAAEGRIKPGTEARTGEIEGAELFISGAVTEFEPNASGAGAGILAATTVEGTATDIGGLAAFRIGGGSSELGVGLGGYKNTPMEKAIRIAIQEAVNYIAAQTPAQYYHR